MSAENHEAGMGKIDCTKSSIRRPLGASLTREGMSAPLVIASALASKKAKNCKMDSINYSEGKICKMDDWMTVDNTNRNHMKWDDFLDILKTKRKDVQ